MPPARALAVCVLVAGCELGAPAPQHAFFDGARPVEVIAHRGGAGLRPENTFEAFEHAAALGADILEMDLRVSADGAIVVTHDASPLTRAELAQRGVPALEEVFRRLPRARMNLEMKQFSPDAARALCALVRRAGMSRRVLVASFGDEAMAAFREACPEVATSLTAREARLFLAAPRIYNPPAPALQIPERFGGTLLATPELAAAARKRGLKLHVWTVNDEARMRELVSDGIDGIITDRPDRLLAALGRR